MVLEEELKNELEKFMEIYDQMKDSFGLVEIKELKESVLEKLKIDNLHHWLEKMKIQNYIYFATTSGREINKIKISKGTNYDNYNIIKELDFIREWLCNEDRVAKLSSSERALWLFIKTYENMRKEFAQVLKMEYARNYSVLLYEAKKYQKEWQKIASK